MHEAAARRLMTSPSPQLSSSCVLRAAEHSSSSSSVGCCVHGWTRTCLHQATPCPAMHTTSMIPMMLCTRCCLFISPRPASQGVASPSMGKPQQVIASRLRDAHACAYHRTGHIQLSPAGNEVEHFWALCPLSQRTRHLVLRM